MPWLDGYCRRLQDQIQRYENTAFRDHGCAIGRRADLLTRGIWVSTINNAVTVGVTLGTAGNYPQHIYSSPLTVTAAGSVETNNGDAVYGPSYSSWSVINQGTIGDKGNSGDGVDLRGGGYINNSGVISGYTGVYVGGGPATVINSGTISGTTKFGYGVDIRGGGSVINSGSILSGDKGYTVQFLFTAGYLSNSNSGYIGFGGVLATGTVVNGGRIVDLAGAGVKLSNGGLVNNFGTITASGGTLPAGIALQVGGTVINSGTIADSGTAGVGIVLQAGNGTVIDSGLISGGSGTAVSFAGTGTNLLALEHGFVVSGSVVGSSSATNTVELLGSAGAAVTANFGSLGLTNFQDLLFGPGGSNTLRVSNTTGTVPIVLSDMTLSSDIVDLTAIGTDGTITQNDTVNHRITVSGSGGTVTLQLDATDSTSFTVASDSVSGTDLMPPCFCRGTLIRTAEGEAPVEELVIGDLVVTVTGQTRPIKWIGRRAYDGRFIVGNTTILPICVTAGALADGIPSRDLFVSPEHALYLNGCFIPAGLLVNAVTIRQVEAVDQLEYFHLELATHDVIFADGAAAETFVDFGGRGIFQNSKEFAELYGDEPAGDWRAYVALLDLGAAKLPAIRGTLQARAERLGRVSRDPDLHLVVGNRVLRPQSTEGGKYYFVAPAGAREVAIASRSVIPRETEANSLDPRRLGVPLERVVLQGRGLRVEIGHDHTGLCEGFHADEGSHRWTNGHGVLPPQVLACFAHDLSIEVEIGTTQLHYALDTPEPVSLSSSRLTSDAPALSPRQSGAAGNEAWRFELGA